jgi:hypothetical protein
MWRPAPAASSRRRQPHDRMHACHALAAWVVLAIRVAVSVLGSLAILFLFVEEYKDFNTVRTESNMYVDMSIGEKLMINFDVTFPVFPCAALHLDAMDISGYQQLELDHSVYKQRLEANGALHREPKGKVQVGE